MTDQTQTEHTIAGAVILPLSTGLTVAVKFLSPTILLALNRKADELYPPPIEDDYKQEITEIKGVPLLPGTTATQPARQNEAYTTALKEWIALKSDYLLDAIVRLAVHPINADHEAKVVAAHADSLREARALGIDTEDENVSDFYRVIRYFHPLSQDDFNLIVSVAQRKSPLTEAELSEGRAFFRLSNLRDSGQRLVSEKQSPRLNGKASRLEKQAVT